MTEGSAVHRPPSLRAVLDAGCDLVATGVWLTGLAEVLYTELPGMPPKVRARRAANWRASVEDLIANGEKSHHLPLWADGTRSVRRGTFQQYVMWELWLAEIHEDEGLAERLRGALPDEVAGEHRALLDCYRRPNPLEVKIPEGEWWHCGNCGASFEEGEQEAVVVTGREGWSEMDELRFCFDCIALVAEVVRQANRS